MLMTETASRLRVCRLTLYKHGVSFVQREGTFTGTELQLILRAREVNDVLKSMVVLDRRGGQVLGIQYDTPADQAARLAEGPIALSADHALLDLLRSLRGTAVRLVLGAGTQVQEIQGRLLGIELAEGAPARRALVSVWDDASGSVVVQTLGDVQQVVLGEERTTEDVRHFLDVSRSEETRRTVTVRLSAGEHDLSVSYLVPSPTWRVSYRLVAESSHGVEVDKQLEVDKPGAPGATGATGAMQATPAQRQGKLLLQGWGLFDNHLEDDLEEAQVTLVAGQPISFVYDLATSRIPARRVMEDQARIAAAPVEFERSIDRRRGRAAPAAAVEAVMAEGVAEGFAGRAFAAAPAAMIARASVAEMAEQPIAATGSDLGELFQYQVIAPVTVRRGASALVPILAAQLPYRRELLFNQQKLPEHPVAALRFTNDTGLVLERGPVTVLEDGEYRGEAIVPFTKNGNDVYLAFSVELGIKVKQTSATRLETAGLRIDKALLWTKQARIVETTYQVTSDLGTAELVTIEHPIRPGYDLVDTRPPDEQTAGWYRWAAPCPPREATTFVVSQRAFEWDQHQVLDLSYHTLRDFLARRWLDAATFERIRSLLQERQAIARNREQIGELQAERDRIYQREEQLRKNLAALSTTGQEAALRQQVFLQLQASEERLNAIDAQIADLHEQNKQRQAALDAALEHLALDEAGDAAASSE